MATHLKREVKNEIYFITFTCHKWLPLIDISKSYLYVNKWFDYLNNHNCIILGYVVMPNHFHALFFVQEDCKMDLNKIVANGKRFWAYEIVKQLELRNKTKLLDCLKQSVSIKEREKGKLHEIFKPSFDSKVCYNRKMVETKLDYIHANPVNGKWNLINDYSKYAHSSASFYELNKPNNLITHYMNFI